MRISDCAIYAINPQGAQLAYRIANAMGGKVFLQQSGREGAFAQYGDTFTVFYSLRDILAQNIETFSFHVLICDAETAWRSMPEREKTDKLGPALLLLDQFGQTVTCLTNCQLTGGNTLAMQLAALLKATPLLSDPKLPELPALDLIAEAKGLHLSNIQALRVINSALLRQEKPLVFDPENHLELAQNYPEQFIFSDDCDFVLACCEAGKPVVFVSTWRMNQRQNVLTLLPKNLYVGLGCRYGVSCDSLHAFLLKALYAVGLSSESIAGIAGIQLQKENATISELCKRLNLPPAYYPAGELDKVSVPNPSDSLKSRIDTHSVCEAAALLSAGLGAGMVLEKFEGAGMTLAIAASAK